MEKLTYVQHDKAFEKSVEGKIQMVVGLVTNFHITMTCTLNVEMIVRHLSEGRSNRTNYVHKRPSPIRSMPWARSAARAGLDVTLLFTSVGLKFDVRRWVPVSLEGYVGLKQLWLPTRQGLRGGGLRLVLRSSVTMCSLGWSAQKARLLHWLARCCCKCAIAFIL